MKRLNTKRWLMLAVWPCACVLWWSASSCDKAKEVDSGCERRCDAQNADAHLACTTDLE